MMPAAPPAGVLPSGCAPGIVGVVVVVPAGALPGVAVLTPAAALAEESGNVAPGAPAVAPPGAVTVGAEPVVVSAPSAEPQAPSSKTIAALVVAPIRELTRVCAPSNLFTSFLASRCSMQDPLSPPASDITGSAEDSALAPLLKSTHP